MNLLIIPTTHPDIYVGVLSFGRNYVLTDGRSTDIIEVKKEGMNMTMQSMLREKNISIYRLSQISGVPKTTVIDICSGTNIEKLLFEKFDTESKIHIEKFIICDYNVIEKSLRGD